MGIEIIYGKVENPQASKQLEDFVKNLNSYTGILFLGYPINTISGSISIIDAILVTKEKGLVIFTFDNGLVSNEDVQDRLYYQIENELYKYKYFRYDRQVIIKPTVITFFSEREHPLSNENYLYCNSKDINEIFLEVPDFDSSLYSELCSFLERTYCIKEKKNRKNVKNFLSKGNLIKSFEKEPIVLDEFQIKLAFNIKPGYQCISGVIGSGKTLSLVYRALFLHINYPEWDIAMAVTSDLSANKVKNIMRKISYSIIGRHPNWNKLNIFSKNTMENQSSDLKYDVILIDDSENDSPEQIISLCSQAKEPKRITLVRNEYPILSKLKTKDIELITTNLYYNSLSNILNVGMLLRQGECRVKNIVDDSLYNDIFSRYKFSRNSYSNIFNRNSDDSFSCNVFENTLSQYKWVAKNISINIKDEELNYEDILIVLPPESKRNYEFLKLKEMLTEKNIKIKLISNCEEQPEKDVIRVIKASDIDISINFSYPMIYILNSQYYEDNSDFLLKRDQLFKSIVSAKMWVRVCGVGQEMSKLKEEINNSVAAINRMNLNN